MYYNTIDDIRFAIWDASNSDNTQQIDDTDDIYNVS